MVRDPLSNTTLGRYRLGPLLGRGGMGDVYRADDPELGRPVAVKVLPDAFTSDADRVARFIHEARAASALNHPHLVSIYEIGRAPSPGGGAPVHFIAMELVRGETLRQVFDARRVDLRRTLEHLAQAADALAAAHAAGVVHRDLKPENIMIAEGGYAKVLDFGLAKLRAEQSLAGTSDETTFTGRAAVPGTSPGIVMGTAGYMSPEQAQGLRVDHRTDIFSFGCILYEAATGTRPFSGKSTLETLHRIVHEQPPPIGQLAPSAPYDLQRIVRKCLAKDPDERYQTIKDVAIDLRDLKRQLDSGPVPSAGAPVLPHRAGGKRVAVLSAVVVLVAIAAAAYWRFQAGSGEAAGGLLRVEPITASGLVIDAVISGDGNYVAYVESEGGRQKLFIRQTRGTRPVELVAPFGGFWGIEFSTDGTSIYYAVKNSEQPEGALFSVPSLGGPSRKLLSGIDSKVSFSPDGKRIAYLRADPDSGESFLMIAGADGGDPRPLVVKRPPEFLAPAFFAAASWSPDGRRIAAAVRDARAQEAHLAVFDVDGGAEHAFPARYAAATFTAWLPDGSGIVLSARLPAMYGTGTGGQLWLQPYPSGEVRRLTTDMLEYRNASITADGRSLLSVAYEVATRLSRLPLDGGSEQPIPEDRSAGAPGLAWAPDGRRIFYIKYVRTELQLWAMNADGTDPRELVANVGPGGVVVSPDGRWIAYVARRDGEEGVWRAASDGSDQRLLAQFAQARWLTIAPDGSELYFTSYQGGTPSTYRLPATGGEPTRVAPLLERAAPSPDGRLLAGVYRETPSSSFSLGILDASNGRPVHMGPNFSVAGSTMFRWMPDGQTVLFTTAERFNIWKRPAAGGPAEKMTEFFERWIIRFELSPDGKTLLLCRGTAMRDAVLMTNFR